MGISPEPLPFDASDCPRILPTAGLPRLATSPASGPEALPARWSRSFQSHRSRRKQVEAERVGHVRNHFLGLHAVAGFVEWRRKYGNRSLAGNDSDNSSTHSAFRG